METLRKTLVIVGGILLIVFGLFHLSFWNLFDWKNELTKLNLENSNIMQILNICISVLLLSFGFIFIFYRKEILNTGIGRALQIAFSIFFFARLILGFVFPGEPIILSFILLCCALVYLIPAFSKLK